MEANWEFLLQILIVLAAVLAMGLLFERLRLGSVPGYLLGGVLVGPGAFALLPGGDAVRTMADIGVALLLFTIGLEFSWRRLVRWGGKALTAGVVATLGLVVVGFVAGLAFGLDMGSAFAVGTVLSMSSTAIVVRGLKESDSLDSVYGRTAIGVTLLQDLALIPFVLFVTFATRGGELSALDLGGALVKTAGLYVAIALVVRYVVPKLLDERVIARNREIPILLSITVCIGSTWGAYSMGLSPALGAFIAGLLLAESKYAEQIRADAIPFRTLFMALFFASVGLLFDVRWAVENIHWLLIATLAVLVVKTVVTYLCLRPFKLGIMESLAAALVVSNIGEFSFVLAQIGFQGRPEHSWLFDLIISTTVVGFFVSTYVVGNAMRISRRLAKQLLPARKLAESQRRAKEDEGLTNHIILVGYGAAGQSACRAMEGIECRIAVIEIDPRLVALALTKGHESLLGDATQASILEHARIAFARTVVVTVPDHYASRIIISQCNSLAPNVPVIARARYHIYAGELDVLGAHIVVDEEEMVGALLGAAVRMGNRPPPPEPDLDPYHSLR